MPVATISSRFFLCTSSYTSLKNSVASTHAIRVFSSLCRFFLCTSSYTSLKNSVASTHAIVPFFLMYHFVHGAKKLMRISLIVRLNVSLVAFLYYSQGLIKKTRLQRSYFEHSRHISAIVVGDKSRMHFLFLPSHILSP